MIAAAISSLEMALIGLNENKAPKQVGFILRHLLLSLSSRRPAGVRRNSEESFFIIKTAERECPIPLFKRCYTRRGGRAGGVVVMGPTV